MAITTFLRWTGGVLETLSNKKLFILVPKSKLLWIMAQSIGLIHEIHLQAQERWQALVFIRCRSLHNFGVTH